MARISNRDRVLDIVDGMNKKLQGSVATLLETIVELSASEDLSDLEESTVSSSRRDKARKGKKTEKVKSRRGRKPKVDEDDADEAPKKRGRSAKADKAEKKSKRSKPEPFDGTPTLDDCYDFLSEFEGEPVEGGIRELKPEVKKLGGNPDVLTEGAETRAEKAEELGMFLAANKALMAKLKLHDEGDISELAEELGIDTDKVKSKNKQITAILVALNSDEEPEDDEDDEDEDEAPKRKSKKSKSKKEKPAKSKKKSRKDDDEDEEDEEDDEDDEDADDDGDDEDDDEDGLDEIDDIDDED